MVMVFWSTVKRRYYAPRFSWAYVVYILGEFLKYGVPFLVGYYTWHFWIHENSLYAKPYVYHTQNFVLGLDTIFNDGTTLVPQTLGYSSFADYNARLENFLRPAKVMSWRDDIDRDGKTDFLNFEAVFQLWDKESVYGCRAFYEVSYKLDERLNIEMLSPIYVTWSGGMPGHKFYFDGDLRFRQRQALQVTNTNTNYNETLITTTTTQSAQSTTWDEIIYAYRQRNDTLHFEGDYVWSPGTTREFTIKGRVRIPTDHYYYVPSFWETFKFGLVQYVALHFLFLTFAEIGMGFVFSQQVVDTRVVSEVPKLHQM